jgi:hypothetical protein
MTLALSRSAPAPGRSTFQLYRLSLQCSLQLRQVPTPAHLRLRAQVQTLADELVPGAQLTLPDRELLRRSLLSTLALAEAGRFSGATPAELDRALGELALPPSVQA